MQHRIRKKKGHHRRWPSGWSLPLWKVKSQNWCLVPFPCIRMQFGSSLSTHLIFLPTATQFCFKSPVRLIDMHRYFFWKMHLIYIYYIFMAVWMQVLNDGHIVKWTESWHSSVLKDNVAIRLFKGEVKCWQLHQHQQATRMKNKKDCVEMWIERSLTSTLRSNFFWTGSRYSHAGVLGAHGYLCSPFVSCRAFVESVEWTCTSNSAV